MEINILSFVLGISVVLVVGGLTVGVIGFFKAIKAKKLVEKLKVDLENPTNEIWNTIDENQKQSTNDLSTLETEIFRDFDALRKELDSRFDKTENKIKNAGVKPINESSGVSGRIGSADGNG